MAEPREAEPREVEPRGAPESEALDRAIRADADVERALPQVSRLLATAPERILTREPHPDDAADTADLHAPRSVPMHLSIELAGLVVEERGVVRYEHLWVADREAWLPFTWSPSGRPLLFPPGEGELVATSTGPSSTRLSLVVRPRPEAGAVGRSLYAVLHRWLVRALEQAVADMAERVGHELPAGDHVRSVG